MVRLGMPNRTNIKFTDKVKKFLQGEKQKKNISSTVKFDHKLLVMSIKDGDIVLEHVQINSGGALKLIFLAWFAVHISEL